jgi:hypothetical protein
MYRPTSYYEQLYRGETGLRSSWQGFLTFAPGVPREDDLDDILIELFGCVFDDTVFEKRSFGSKWAAPPDELEYSYTLELELMLNRFLFVLALNSAGQEVANYQRTFRATWSDFRKYAPIFIEVARFFNELVLALLGDSPIHAINRDFTLSSLVRRCNDLGHLKQDLNISVELPLLYNKMNTLSSEDVIWGALVALCRIRRLPINSPPSDMNDLPIHDLFFQLTHGTLLDDETKDYSRKTPETVHFETTGLSVKSLKEIGGLKPIWSNKFDDHLDIDVGNKTITLFWDASLLWYPFYWPRLPAYP